MITIKDLEHRVHGARNHVILDVPMAQSSAVKMPIFFSDKIPTAATDGHQIGFGPAFVASIDDEELEFVVVHEWGHKMLRHPARLIRMRAALPGVWTRFHDELANEAADQEDNYLVEKTGFKLLSGALRDVRFDEMPMEEIFQILLHERIQPEAEEGQGDPSEDPGGNEDGDESKDKEDGGEESEENTDESDSGGNEGEGQEDSDGNSNGDDQDSPRDDQFGQNGLDESVSVSSEDIENYKTPEVKDWGRIEIPDSMTESEIYQEEIESKIDQSNEIVTSKLSGKLPEEVERILRDINHKSQIDWVAEMAEFISDACGEDSDETWSRPNKRFAPMDIYMPSMFKEGLGEIAVLIDSSGSMNDEMYSKAASECAHLINSAEPAVTHVVEFTSQIVSSASYDGGIEIDNMPERQAWGGTDVRIAFDWLSQNAPDTTGIIVISDMEFFKWPDDTGIPVLWAKVPPREDNSWYFGKPAFGKTITIR